MRQVDPHAAKSLSPPQLCTGWVGAHGSVRRNVVEHDVEMPGIGVRGEDLAGHPKRWESVVILLDDLGQCQCDLARPGRRHRTILTMRFRCYGSRTVPVR